jgi:hypothetical protein
MSTTMNRRTILAGAAALPAMSIPAIAAEPDPIFAAIERSKIAYRVHGEVLETDYADEDYAKEMRNAACAEDCTARDALLTIKPTTLAGHLRPRLSPGRGFSCPEREKPRRTIPSGARLAHPLL